MIVRKLIPVLLMAACLVTGMGKAVLAAEDDGVNGNGVHYVDANIQNISDVLIHMGIIRLDDPATVEEYIRIHDCPIYEQYGQDDFAWTRIREAKMRDLSIRIQDMGNGLEISTPLLLSQYDMVNNTFDIAAPSRIENMVLLTLLDNDNGNFNTCENERLGGFVPRVHPLKLVLKVDTPFNFVTVPMSREMADKLIDIIKARQKEGDPPPKRLAMLVLRVRITGTDNLTSATDPLRRTVTGLLDDVRVFDGPERNILLYSKEFQNPLEKSATKR